MIMLQFSGVACDRIAGLTFALEAGQIRVVRVATREDKLAVLELSAGERMPDQGAVSLLGAPLAAAAAGSIGWVPEFGGLISNLKVWENVTLPLWYHGRRRAAAVEEKVRYWLGLLGVPESDMRQFMASPTGRLKPLERKLAGLLRCLLQEPQLLVLDVALFGGIAPDRRNSWVEALETFVRLDDRRAGLLVADGDSLLPWGMVEQE